jgi:hypothetical protein
MRVPYINVHLTFETQYGYRSDAPMRKHPLASRRNDPHDLEVRLLEQGRWSVSAPADCLATGRSLLLKTKDAI